MNINDAVRLTGVSAKTIRDRIAKGVIKAECTINAGDKHKHWNIEPKVVYQFAWDEWFIGRANVFPPNMVAEGLLNLYEKELDERFRNQLLAVSRINYYED